MKVRISICLISIFIANIFAGEKEEQVRFDSYKESVKQNPSLIRFYTFEEGSGIEVSNHVLLDPARTAQTGGTLGSLTIQRYIYGNYQGNPIGDEMIPPTWTRGRWPWKSAVSSGLDNAPHAWNVTKLFRSGITGAEFSNGMTLTTWIRIHENTANNESCFILTLGGGWRKGFNLSYNKYRKNGMFNFRLGSPAGTPRADLSAGPISQGTWQYVAVTLNGNMATIYLNGKMQEQKPFSLSVEPTNYRDYPLVGPFYENYSPSRFGSFLMIAHNTPKKGEITSQFDIDELSIYSKGLNADDIAKLMAEGSPTMSTAEQLADYREVATKRELCKKIQMDIPEDTGRYFRIKKPIAATINIPAATGLKGKFKARFDLETLVGKPVQTINRTISVGESFTENILPPECGVYYLDITLFNTDGSILKHLDEKLCIAIVPPAPASLSEHNPVALWADTEDLFDYDAPIRRMCYYKEDGSFFCENYAKYKARIPNFRAYMWFNTKKEDTKEAKEFNKALYKSAIKHMKGKSIFGIELTSEPHTKNISAYVDMLRTARKIILPEMPGLKFFPPGAAPSSIPMIAEILKNGGIDYVDGVSYHTYTANPIGTFLWDNSTDRLKQVVNRYPHKNLTIWNTECGINSLFRINGRPMPRKDAHAARFPTSELYGHQFFPYFISLQPEEEAAALQCHDILLDLLQGYQIYTICQAPRIHGQPSLRGVAVTTLAGQILNNQTDVTRLSLAAVENMCLLVKQTDGTTIAAIFSMEPATLNLKVQPNATYKTMDMLGNTGTIKANSDGLITARIQKAPLYIFNVPANIKEVVPLQLSAPKLLPENGILSATLTISNPFKDELVGVLSAPKIPGAKILLSKDEIKLAAGEKITIPVTLKAESLKCRSYLLSVELRDKSGTDSNLIAAAQTIFTSSGIIQQVTPTKTTIALGNLYDWNAVPEARCDDSDSVVHGKPNYAEMWIPQWANAKDLSFGVKTVWQKDDGIYFLLNVRDDVLMPAPDDKIGIAFKYDCLELFFDSREYSKQGTTISEGADQVIIVPQAGKDLAPCKLWYAKKDNHHINVECVGRKTEEGYMIEGKITPNELSKFRIRAGSQFRMDFLIDDTDSPKAELMRKSTMALHGFFNNYSNSGNWGRYEL